MLKNKQPIKCYYILEHSMGVEIVLLYEALTEGFELRQSRIAYHYQAYYYYISTLSRVFNSENAILVILVTKSW